MAAKLEIKVDRKLDNNQKGCNVNVIKYSYKKGDTEIKREEFKFTKRSGYFLYRKAKVDDTVDIESLGKIKRFLVNGEIYLHVYIVYSPFDGNGQELKAIEDLTTEMEKIHEELKKFSSNMIVARFKLANDLIALRKLHGKDAIVNWH